MAETPDPAEYDWTVPRGSCETLSIQLEDESEELINLLGYQAELSITWKTGSLFFTTQDGDSPSQMFITPDLGQIDVELTPEETAQFPVGRMTKHKWWLIEPDGCRKVPLIGYIIGA